MNRHDRRAAERRSKCAPSTSLPPFKLPHQTAAEAEADREAARVDDMTFFERFPKRSHRVRPAVLVEMRDAVACGSIPVVPPDGRWSTIVCQVRPGTRFKGVDILPTETPVDPDEAQARALWRQHAPPGSEADRIVKAAREHGL